MSTIEEAIEVEVPVRAVYDQWTQFEDFPRFMAGVEQVRQVDETHLHWVATIAGVRREWDALITEQLPDKMVTWTSTSGTRNDGLVTFDGVTPNRTRVLLRLELEPEGPVETIGDALGVVRARTRGDLNRFKEFIEERRLPTGAWRGEIAHGQVVDDVGATGVADVRTAAPVPEPAGIGEVPASTGGVVDLDRVLGTMPLVLVFVDPVDSPAVRSVVAALGRRLAEFGRERVQVLVVAKVDQPLAVSVADEIEGEVRIVADQWGDLAERFGVQYLPEQLAMVLVDRDGQTTQVWYDAPGSEFVPVLAGRVERAVG
jgi:peroxiredoxin